MTLDGVWDWIFDLLTAYTQLGITINGSAIANLHTLQITTAHLRLFPACCTFISRFLSTASNSGDFSASRLQILLSQQPVQNSCQLSTQL
jgi:hypothetical protein